MGKGFIGVILRRIFMPWLRDQVGVFSTDRIDVSAHALQRNTIYSGTSFESVSARQMHRDLPASRYPKIAGGGCEQPSAAPFPIEAESNIISLCYHRRPINEECVL